MTKVLITGSPGVGKTTIIHELQKLGHTAYDTDELPDVTRLEVKATGEPTEWPKGIVDWESYAWSLQKKGLIKLLESDNDVYIGSVTSNQHEFYDLFDVVIGLYVESETHLKRLQSRPEREFNNSPDAHERIISRAKAKKELFESQGAIMIENSGLPNDTAQKIIALSNDK